MSSCEALLLSDEDLSEPTLVDFAGGRAAVFSVRGPGRDRGDANEDGAVLIPVDDTRGVLAVADGMGGGPAGASASAIALARLRDAVVAVAPQQESLRAAILDGIEAANRAILDLGIGAATTLAVAEIDDGSLRAVHVGDSGIFVVGQRGKVKLQTMMHSPVGYAVEAGVLDEREALHHEERHIVSNMVGSASMRIEVGSPLRLAPRDSVLLATDGLLDNLGPQEIVELIRVRPLQSVAERLVRTCAKRMAEPRAGQPSKPDDLTFVLYRPTA